MIPAKAQHIELIYLVHKLSCIDDRDGAESDVALKYAVVFPISLVVDTHAAPNICLPGTWMGARNCFAAPKGQHGFHVDESVGGRQKKACLM